MLEFYPVFPQNNQLNQIDYYWFEKGFSNVEIRNVLRISKLYDFQEALTQSEIEFNDSKKEENPIRKSNIKWMAPEADKTEWLYYKLMQQALEANFNYWKFDLSCVKDAIQYTEYNGEEGGGYDWHLDVGPAPLNHRKISITVQLSDPDDYEGGDLEIWAGGKEPIKAPKQKGAVVMFPSYLMHRITPVTKGVRKSLVLWVGGNTFK
jgi:PKHD-type hydroxylase